MVISGFSLGKDVDCHAFQVAKSSPPTRHTLAIGTVQNESAVSDTRDTMIVPQLTGSPPAKLVRKGMWKQKQPMRY